MLIDCLHVTVLSGVDIDSINANGQTSLFYTCLEGPKKLVSVLLKRGANPNL